VNQPFDTLKVVPLRNSPYIKARKEGVIRAPNPLTKTPLQRSDDMADARPIITQDRLKEVLHYDPETGIFTNRVTRNQLSVAGQQAGFITKPQGYRTIGLSGRQYREHRLAWLYVHGVWPSGDIDHINGNPADNRLCNLRDGTTQDNCNNQRKTRSDNTSGLMGARLFRPGKWQASIRSNGEYMHLGTFDNPEEAHLAYMAAKRKYHPTFTL
jgi:hypothetical protein